MSFEKKIYIPERCPSRGNGKVYIGEEEKSISKGKKHIKIFEINALALRAVAQRISVRPRRSHRVSVSFRDAQQAEGDRERTEAACLGFK